jgi:hypothetical protein
LIFSHRFHKVNEFYPTTTQSRAIVFTKFLQSEKFSYFCLLKLLPMKCSKIVIRPATIGDAPTLAQVVAMAIGDEETLYHYCGANYLTILREVARTKGTQYSWENGLIAEVDGVCAGAVVGYDGAHLEALRRGTLAVIHRHAGICPARSIP